MSPCMLFANIHHGGRRGETFYSREKVNVGIMRLRISAVLRYAGDISTTDRRRSTIIAVLLSLLTHRENCLPLRRKPSTEQPDRNDPKTRSTKILLYFVGYFISVAIQGEEPQLLSRKLLLNQSELLSQCRTRPGTCCETDLDFRLHMAQVQRRVS